LRSLAAWAALAGRAISSKTDLAPALPGAFHSGLNNMPLSTLDGSTANQQAKALEGGGIHACSSDRGSQYASHDYQRAIGVRGIICRMSRKGNCWDNAVMESFFATLKKELIYTQSWADDIELKAALFEYNELIQEHGTKSR
jgi:hypothetical protein